MTVSIIVNMSECLQFLHMEVTIDNLNVAKPIMVMVWSALWWRESRIL